MLQFKCKKSVLLRKDFLGLTLESVTHIRYEIFMRFLNADSLLIVNVFTMFLLNFLADEENGKKK